MCKECGYQCISKPYILRHLELHKPDGPKSISCSHCGWLVVAAKINQHIAARHPGQGIGVPNRRMRRKVPTKPVPYHKCGECGYLVRRPVELAKHLKLHESGEGQICEECG
ncbi:unnamed protein product [Orchesella dallaii]|uniref:C2H2-type domain-containing protein n=1 Tax=Orchesella dallaii TaxID=48710 RepID=A0ABP1RU79_9HEXA